MMIVELSSLNRVSRNPLNAPQSVPTIRAIRTHSTTGQPCSNAHPATHPDSVMMDAMEMSISPRISTIMVP